VYASRLGLEFALAGRRAWLLGEQTYRGKGFTRDVTSREEMCAALDAGDMSEPLSPADVERAERFAYLWFFRYVTRLPLLRPLDERFTLQSFASLAPGGDPVVERICEALTTSAPFLNLAG